MRLRTIAGLACIALAAPAARAQCALELEKLRAGDTDLGDAFGTSVSVAGSTAVIGASADNHGGFDNVGAAYVFGRTPGGWTESQKLTPSDGANYRFFGGAVCVDGDRALISGHGGRRAYVFERTGMSWSEEAILSSPSTHTLSEFGWRVALDGDVAAVTAPLEPFLNLFIGMGAVYVFERQGTVWNGQVRLVPSDANTYPELGWSVDLDGDTLAVGAADAVYVFERSGSMWAERVKLDPTTPGVDLGAAVHLTGDTLLAGAPRETPGGSVYVYTRTGTSWGLDTKLAPADGSAGDRFGVSISRSGDVAVIGAYEDDDGAPRAGSAYVFARTGTTWTEELKLLPGDTGANQRFGYATAVSGSTVFAGAAGDDEIGFRAGAAYVFDLGLRSNYCAATPNSTGGAAAIGATGCSSLTTNDLVLHATPVPDTPGIFFYGTVPIQTPFGNGFRCVGGATARSPFVFGTGGTTSWALDLTAPPHDAIGAGDTRYFQAWFRDPTAGGSLFDLSDALEVTFAP